MKEIAGTHTEMTEKLNCLSSIIFFIQKLHDQTRFLKIIALAYPCFPIEHQAIPCNVGVLCQNDTGHP
jgi:hypothetical protein